MDRFAKRKQDTRQAYVEHRDRIDTLIGEIRVQLDRDTRREEITWASVGSLGHVEELLRQIHKFLS